MITIRDVTDSELAWANARYEEIGFRPSKPGGGLVIVAEIDGERVGLARLVDVGGGAQELGGVYVLEPYRRHGVARALVDELIGRRRPGATLYCLPYAKLHAFYESAGFRACIGRELASVPEDVREKHAWCNRAGEPRTLLYVYGPQPAGDRPANIRHWRDLQQADDARYSGSDELLGIGSPFAWILGLKRLGIHHVLLPPGRRTSWPHAEEDEEEFVYVIEGEPHVWMDGEVHQLSPGDGVAFPCGTGLCHTFLNDTDRDVRLLVVGEASKKGSKIYYPLNPERQAQVGDNWWNDVPRRPQGSHDGLPGALRAKRQTSDRTD